VVTPELLLQKGYVKQIKTGIKILGNKEINVELTVKANKFSDNAVKKIAAAGGQTEVI